MAEMRYCLRASYRFLFLPLLLPSLLSFFVLVVLLFAVGAAAQNATQAAIMRDISSLVNSESATTKWNTADPNICNWIGINCSSGSVINITLSNYGISNSSIFASICRLETLQILDLSRNSLKDLTHFFPSSCPMKESLRFLNLSSNQFAYTISQLSGLPQLEVLDLSTNSFTSENLSTQLGSFPKLTSLNLSYNNLMGALPTSMVHSSLVELVVSGNQLTDSIPLDLFKYESLTLLDLSQNKLTDAVPDMFMSLPKLHTLLLSGNELSGEIPGSLLNLTSLYRFAANQNNFTGPVPSNITKHVRMLDLSYNHLNGSIPSDFLSHSGLQTVDLTGNMLEGAIPGNLSGSLFRLRLGQNMFSGSIPPSICDAIGLTYLELDNNQLFGNIPSELGNCKNLSLLSLESNNLQGSVTDSIRTLDKLVVLKLQNNRFSGPIPNTVSASLSILNLSHNSFSGEIPSGIFNLQKLATLDLHGNNISGAIPISISSSQSLIELNLGNNALIGTIPTMPTTLTTALNLSHNYLSGSIPSSIARLGQLEILDLSHNNLSGEVPSSLAGSLQSLTQLVLSYNDLSGPVPKFRQPVQIDVSGNPHLGDSNGSPAVGKRKKHTVIITIIIIIGALIGLCTIAVIVMISMSKRTYRVEDERLPAGDTVPQIINGRFITVNSIHTSAIVFMKAMEAVSDHQNIFLKTRFCTYYKAVMPNGSTYAVKRLNWTDKIFQIGRQEKFGHELEVLGKLSNSNVMVPLAYVLTEDNAFLVYDHVYKGTVFDFLHGGKSDVLDWPSRYSIALGVAQGLTFLHGCTQPVLLLDLSTRTIHLKSINEPQIGDIELYKIIDPSKSTGSFSTIAGTVGYIPPEYAYTMRLTMAGNVYSFGVILLELLTGKPSVTDGTELSKWALSLSSRPEQREQILDARISGTSIAVHSQMLSVLNIALSCVAFSPDARPKMRNVLRMLFNAK